MKLGELNQRRFWSGLTIVAAALAILKGLRLPNLWSATQMQFGYQFGFIKRGAVGAVLHAARVPVHHYWVFAAIAFLLLLVTVCTGALFIRRHALTTEAQTWTPVFVSSFAVTYVAHMVGYLDLILLTMTMLTLASSRKALRPALDYLVCACAVLVHEEFALTFFPLIWFYWVLEATDSRLTQRRLSAINAVALPVVVCCLSLIVALWRPMTALQMSTAEHAISVATDFPVRKDFLQVMQRSLADNVHIMAGKFRTAGWWLDEMGAALALLWVGIFFAWRSNRLIEAARVVHPLLLKSLAACASFAPALMQLIGWDLYRWYALTALASFGVYLLTVRRLSDAPGAESSSGERAVAILLVALNLSTGAGLLDGYTVNTFPFIDPVKALIKSTVESGHVPLPAM
ncbi:MAG TPA: hypothetical protein VJQ47_13590 [Steroidobacteraceae bacterium]|nr:hypothetical protein [Steroidobacteraceae bacterium]